MGGSILLLLNRSEFRQVSDCARPRGCRARARLIWRHASETEKKGAKSVYRYRTGTASIKVLMFLAAFINADGALDFPIMLIFAQGHIEVSLHLVDGHAPFDRRNLRCKTVGGNNPN